MIEHDNSNWKNKTLYYYHYAAQNKHNLVRFLCFLWSTLLDQKKRTIKIRNNRKHCNERNLNYFFYLHAGQHTFAFENEHFLWLITFISSKRFTTKWQCAEKIHLIFNTCVLTVWLGMRHFYFCKLASNLKLICSFYSDRESFLMLCFLMQSLSIAAMR